MGKFDGYLICSDLDGTFQCGAETARINSEAVEYYTQNGGKFTFATGRTVSYLRQYEFIKCVNAPACLYNGGIIYDYKNEKVLFEKRLNFPIKDFAGVAGEGLKNAECIVIYHDYMAEEGVACQIKDIPDTILGVKPIKIVCIFKSTEDADSFKKMAKGQKLFEHCYISKSWNVSVEFNINEATKGHGLKFIKNHLGGIHTAVGIGDYENDIPRIQQADIGVAVGNAVDDLKSIANIIVKPGADCAVKDLIEILERNGQLQ